MKQRLERVIAESPSKKFSEFYENFAKLTVDDNYFEGESFAKLLKYAPNYQFFIVAIATGENEAAAELASSMVRRGISAGIAELCYEFFF